MGQREGGERNSHDNMLVPRSINVNHWNNTAESRALKEK